jgi:hypothetical protein
MRAARATLQPISACNGQTKELGNTTDDRKTCAPMDLKILAVYMA